MCTAVRQSISIASLPLLPMSPSPDPTHYQSSINQSHTDTSIQKTLIWTCTCSDGKEPENLDQYLGTIPQKACYETFTRCNVANPGADKCKEPACGTLDAKTVKQETASTSSAAASNTAAPSSTVTAATPSGSPGAGTRFLPEMGFVAGVAAAMGVLL